MKRLAKILVLAICVLSVFCLLAVSASALDDTDAGYKIVHADSTANYYAKGSATFADDLKNLKDDDTLVLLDDITIAALTDVQKGTLDLNGHTVTFTGEKTDRIFRNLAGTVFNIVGPGTLDGGVGGIGMVYSKSGSTMNLSNLTIKSNSDGTYCFNMNTGHLNLNNVIVSLGSNMKNSVVQVYHDRSQAAAEVNFTNVTMTNASSVNAYILISNHNDKTFAEGAEKVDFRLTINGSVLRAKNFVQVDDVKGIITGGDNNFFTITEPANAIVRANGGTVDSVFSKLISGSAITFGKAPANPVAKYADGSAYALDVPGFLTMIDAGSKDQEVVMLSDIAVTQSNFYGNGLAEGKTRVARNVNGGNIYLNLNGHTLSADTLHHNEANSSHLFYNYNRSNFLVIKGSGNINLKNCGLYDSAIDAYDDNKCGISIIGDSKDAIVVTIELDNSLSGHNADDFVRLRGGMLSMKNAKLSAPNTAGKNNYMLINNEYRKVGDHEAFGCYAFESCTIESKNTNAFLYGIMPQTKVIFRDCDMYLYSNLTRSYKNGADLPAGSVVDVLVDNCAITGSANANQLLYNGSVAITGVHVTKGTTTHNFYNGYGSVWTVDDGCFYAKSGAGYVVTDKQPVASVNGKYLADVIDLMKAIDDSSNNDAFVLLADITIDSDNFKGTTDANVWVTRRFDVNYSIDLNGHTVTANSLVTSGNHYLFYNYNRSAKLSLIGHGTINLNKTGLYYANINTDAYAPKAGLSVLGDAQGITINFEMDASTTPLLNIVAGDIVMKNVNLNVPNTSKAHNYQIFVYTGNKYATTLTIEDCVFDCKNTQACIYNFNAGLATVSLKNTDITCANVLFRPNASATDTLKITIDGGKLVSTNMLYLGANAENVPNTCNGGMVLKKGTEINSINGIYGTAWTIEEGMTLAAIDGGYKVVSKPKLAANLTLSANLDYNLFLNAEDHAYVTDAKYVKGGVEYPLGFEAFGDGYIASINNIAPAFIADTFNVEIVFGGETYVWENLSVLDYAARMMASDCAAEEKTAIATVVAYAKVLADYAGITDAALEAFDTTAALTETAVPEAGNISPLEAIFDDIDFVAGEKAGYRFIAKAGVGTVSFTVNGEIYTHDFATDDTVVLALHADALAAGVTVSAGEINGTVTLGNLKSYMGAALANYAAAFSAAYAD